MFLSLLKRPSLLASFEPPLLRRACFAEGTELEPVAAKTSCSKLICGQPACKPACFSPPIANSMAFRLKNFFLVAEAEEPSTALKTSANSLRSGTRTCKPQPHRPNGLSQNGYGEIERSRSVDRPERSIRSVDRSGRRPA